MLTALALYLAASIPAGLALGRIIAAADREVSADRGSQSVLVAGGPVHGPTSNSQVR